MKTTHFMKVTVLWDIAPCSPYMNQRFGGMYYFLVQGRKSADRETSVLSIRTALSYVPENYDFRKYRCESFKY
jgi:hypothetical protein